MVHYFFQSKSMLAIIIKLIENELQIFQIFFKYAKFIMFKKVPSHAICKKKKISSFLSSLPFLIQINNSLVMKGTNNTKEENLPLVFEKSNHTIRQKITRRRRSVLQLIYYPLVYLLKFLMYITICGTSSRI
jgi:hypothetical protein